MFAVLLNANIVREGGFEKLDPWGKALHDQDFASISQDKVDYMEGLASLRLQINDTPRVYIASSQHLGVKPADRIAKGSFYYKAPEGGGTFFLNFHGKKGLKGYAKGLPATSEWKKVEFEHFFGEGAKSARVEIRMSKKGYLLFDDLKIELKESTADQAKIDLLFVNCSKIAAAFRAGLEKRGYKNIQFTNWDELTPDLLKRTSCITILPLQRLSFSEQDDMRFKLIEEYVANGGGLLLTQCLGQMLADTLLPVRLGDMFGLDIRYETTVFSKDKLVKLGDQHGDTYYQCTDIAAPFNKGLKTVLYPGTSGQGSLHGNKPFTGDKNWQIIMKSDAGSYSRQHRVHVLNVYQERVDGKESFKGNVPMAGVRKFGKGHVAYIGLEPSCSITMHDDQKAGRKISDQVFADDGLMGFLGNVYEYLTTNSAQVAAGKFTPIPEVKDSTNPPKLYRGIVGARTTYSSGKSSVAEYVAAAKKAGMDFIIFLEEFDKLSYKNFEALRNECKKFSKDNFLALPGFTYKNIDDNNQFVYGNYPLYPADVLLDSKRRFKTTDEKIAATGGLDLNYLYSQLSFQANSGWYNFSKNPYPAIDARSVGHMGVVTQENGKTIDNSEADYANFNRNVQYIWPLAITLMKSADEVKLIENGTYYYNQLFASSYEQFIRMMTTKAARSSRNCYPGVPCYGRMAYSQGPVFTLTMPRGDMNPDGSLYASVLNVWPLTVEAKADENIKTIEIFDGEVLLKRFYPNSKEFSYKTILANDRQRHIWGKLVTASGKEAVTRSMGSDSWILRDIYCMDRNNPLLYTRQKHKNGDNYLINYAADGAMPWKGPWWARVRAVGAFVSDPYYGKGKLRYDGSPEYHPAGGMVPTFYTNDKLPPKYGRQSWRGDFIHNVEGGAHNRPNVVVLSSNVISATQELDGVFPVGAFPIIHTHATLFPFKKSEYLETKARRTHYLVRVGGVAPWLYEQHFKLLKDYPVTGEKKYLLSPGGISTCGSSLKRAWLDGKEVHSPKGLLQLKKGDILTYEGNFYGTLAVYILCDGLHFDVAHSQFVYLAPDGVGKAGTEFDLKILFGGINRLEKDPFAVALKYGKDFGMVETGKVGYDVQLQKGKVLANEYTLDLNSDFKGVIKGLAPLNGNLGVRLFNMCNNFSAMVACDGKKRLIPVEEGIAYAVLNDLESDKNLAIGHPFRTDNKDLTILISGDASYSKWVAEIHNPTAETVKTVLKSNPDLTGYATTETITLKPGEYIRREFK